MTQQPLTIVEHVTNVFENARSIHNNSSRLATAIRFAQRNNTGYFSDEEWDRVLLELKHDFEDGLKSVLALRKTFDADQEFKGVR